MKQGDKGLEPDTTTDSAGQPKKTYFQFAEAQFHVDTVGGFGSDIELAGTLFPQYSQIGTTGLIIEFQKAKLDLSRTTNIAEADAAGYPVDFIGLYVQKASILFPSFENEDGSISRTSIFAKDVLIGTGGFSGTIGLEANGRLYRKFGTNFAAELNEFSITFKQGAIVSSSIKGTLTIPKFQKGSGPATVAIQANLFDNGDFNITASPQLEPYVITLPNVMELEVRSLSLGKRNDKYFIQIAGKLNFIANLPFLGDMLPKNLEITKLLIWDDGHFEFEGGSITVPKAFRLEVGPVKLEVSNISLGGYTKKVNGEERKYHFFGFDGMINTGRAGVSATGNGIKYYFTIDDAPGKPFDHFVRIDGIGIDITIPGNADKEKAAFLLNGYLSMKNPDKGPDQSGAATEYIGSVSFSLPKIKLSGSAGMRLQPSVPAFVVDIGLELATPIPIGGTGLGIYGFRGLIGQHFLPDKSETTPPLPDTATWWEYYKAKSKVTKREGIEIDKFGSKSGFSFGAGASIATTADSGKAFSSKLFLLLGLPDVFLIQGQAAILRDRIGLKDDVDPPFSALIAFSDRSVRGNLGVNYNLPEKDEHKGKILSLQGNLDMAFFFNNASGWYLNIGKDNPESERVQAKVLTLFQGHAYLMLSMQGIRAGAGVKYDFKKSYGPVSVGIGAFLNIGGFISFKPVQVSGYIQLGGYAYLKVAWFSTSISIAASLAVEAPHPFNIIGSLRIIVETPRFVPNIDVTVSLSWRKNSDKGPLRAPIPVLGLPDAEKGYMPAIAVNILSNETFQLNYVTGGGPDIPAPDTDGWKYRFTKANPSADPDVVIPLDCFIDIDLLKPVKPGNVPLGGANNQLADGYRELLPPQKGVERQVNHELELTELKIYAWEPGSNRWVEYHIYEAVTAIALENATKTGTDDYVQLDTLKPGYWQFMEPNRFNKIRLLSQHMFSFASKTTSSYTDLDARNFGRKDVFCFNNIVRRTVIDWKAEQENTTYPGNIPVTFKASSFLFTGVSGSVKHDMGFNANSLSINGINGTLEIIFPEPLSEVRLNFGANTNDVEIKFGQTTYTVDQFGQAIAQTGYLSPESITKSQQPQEIAYNSGGNADPVNKVILSFINPQLPYIQLDYDGDLVIGGYFELPENYPSLTISEVDSNTTFNKALQFVSLYNRSFTTAEIINMSYQAEAGIVAQWRLENNLDTYNNYHGIISGSPGTIPGFYEEDTEHILQLHEVYSFSDNADALVVAYAPGLKVENGSFSFEATIIFDPYTAGISTLLYKIKEDSGYKKGYALHLCQSTPGINGATYANASDIPEFTVLLTCYNGSGSSLITISEKYTSNCSTAELADKQYKHIFISVNRSTNKIEAYIDSILKITTDIPTELNVLVPEVNFTYLSEFSYITARQQIRLADHPITEAHVIDEVRVMGDGINKVMQPVWRPNTTYAIKLKTRDVITDNNYNADPEKTHIFGFRTVGPVGHFHQQNKKFIDLANLDRADEFKLATLKHYIDYERSFPDAQSRYDLGKPVFTASPQIRLFFTKPYINAMFSTWATYLGLPSVECRLDLQLLDPEGITLIPTLTWETLPEVEISAGNVDSFVNSLPEDLKIIYYLNQAASNDGCNAYPIPIKKRVKQGVYKFKDPLQANTLYTAVFKSVYKKDNDVEQQAEVHKFSFKTSRYATFLQQVKSFILDDTTGSKKYAIYTRQVAFTADDINTKIKLLINDQMDDDPAIVLQYAVQFDRLMYGGLLIKDLEPVENTTITLVINTDKNDNNARRILGLLIRSPEPFNDPKLPVRELNNTIKLGNAAGSLQGLIYIHSRDTSAVFITNSTMDIPPGIVRLTFNYITFNGTTYDMESFTSPVIPEITLSLT